MSGFQALTASSSSTRMKERVRPSRKKRWHGSLLPSRPVCTFRGEKCDRYRKWGTSHSTAQHCHTLRSQQWLPREAVGHFTQDHMFQWDSYNMHTHTLVDTFTSSKYMEDNKGIGSFQAKGRHLWDVTAWDYLLWRV